LKGPSIANVLMQREIQNRGIFDRSQTEDKLGKR
jgi:hypothetical protein